MPNRLFGLLVGVNDYGPGVGSLAGCLNDVDRLREYLEGHVDRGVLALEVLRDRDSPGALLGRATASQHHPRIPASTRSAISFEISSFGLSASMRCHPGCCACRR